ncbi:MAG: hypothetical protein JO287_12340 [Pseudonocardiales bacterium]|nr:hypothetical protein [Pseudonocardiales bacterium]
MDRCPGRTALLTGELDTLAVTIGEQHCSALYTPARDQHGHINPDQLTAALTELHQAATASDVADQLTHPHTRLVSIMTGPGEHRRPERSSPSGAAVTSLLRGSVLTNEDFGR